MEVDKVPFSLNRNLATSLTDQVVESVMRRTQRLLERKFARHGKAWLPDVLYFSDDYVAMAALLVLVMHGVRIPQDVGIVTWANRGLGPVAPFSLTV